LAVASPEPDFSFFGGSQETVREHKSTNIKKERRVCIVAS